MFGILFYRSKSIIKKDICKDIYCNVVYRVKKLEIKCVYKSGMVGKFTV